MGKWDDWKKYRAKMPTGSYDPNINLFGEWLAKNQFKPLGGDLHKAAVAVTESPTPTTWAELQTQIEKYGVKGELPEIKSLGDKFIKPRVQGMNEAEDWYKGLANDVNFWKAKIKTAKISPTLIQKGIISKAQYDISENKLPYKEDIIETPKIVKQLRGTRDAFIDKEIRRYISGMEKLQRLNEDQRRKLLRKELNISFPKEDVNMIKETGQIPKLRTPEELITLKEKKKK